MLRRLALVLTICVIVGTPPALISLTAASSKSSGSSKKKSSDDSKKKKSSDGEGKTVHVKKYTKKDGTVVEAYDRRPPNSASTSTSAATEGTTPASASSTTSGTVTRDANGRIVRSAAAKEAFMRETGYPHGRPGYIVDHIVPLACGGPDAPSNMQWQTVAEGKAKDKVERIGCGSITATPAGYRLAPTTTTPSGLSATPTTSTAGFLPPASTAIAASGPAAPTTLIGLSEAELKARAGNPSLATGNVWYYDRAAGTLRVYVDHGVVTHTEPANLDLASLTPTRIAPAGVMRPPPSKPPGGAIARCGDGSYVLFPHKNGICFGHGGVAERLDQ